VNELDRLASIGAQLVARIRDDDPDLNGKWLASVTSEEDRWALLFVLAAMVPTDQTVAELLEWVEADSDENVARRRLVVANGLRGGLGRRRVTPNRSDDTGGLVA